MKQIYKCLNFPIRIVKTQMLFSVSYILLILVVLIIVLHSTTPRTVNPQTQRDLQG